MGDLLVPAGLGGVTMSVAPVAAPGALLDLEWPVLVRAAVLLLLLCLRAPRGIGPLLGAMLLAAFAVDAAILLTWAGG